MWIIADASVWGQSSATLNAQRPVTLRKEARGARPFICLHISNSCHPWLAVVLDPRVQFSREPFFEFGAELNFIDRFCHIGRTRSGQVYLRISF